MRFPEYIDNFPNLSGEEDLIESTISLSRNKPVFTPNNKMDFSKVRAVCAVALHMHQPLIPAGGSDIHTATIISNLAYMMDHQDIGDNHNAPAFVDCYKRMGNFIPQLVNEGQEPRIMLDYSGTLLHGLRQMGRNDVIEALTIITNRSEYNRCVEWLGMAWGHPVAPSTPVQDFRLHVQAWQQHFAGIFGTEALERVRGFSPSEMAIPNHPDVAYEFIKTLTDCGYHWILVQEHTVEEPDTGRTPTQSHVPHRLRCINSKGQQAEIIAIIKTQGSDTKLVGQMQPWYEARSSGYEQLGNHRIPPLVTQIADGENGGVMMNEFPSKYFDVVRESSHTDVPLMTVSEYLEHIDNLGVQISDLPLIQPAGQQKIWSRIQPGDGSEKLQGAIDSIRHEDQNYNMEGGSWTNNISWVEGYDNILQPMDSASALFYQEVLQRGVSPSDPRYRKALFHLLACETSCYRYWGQGIWTEYGKEICERARRIIHNEIMNNHSKSSRL